MYFELPDGTWATTCFATAVERPHKEIAKATEEPRNPQGGSQSSQQGNSQQSTQSCRLLRIDSDGTKVLDCGGGTIVYVDPDSSMAPWEDLRSEHKLQGETTGQSRQDENQQGGNQQSDVRQGYGCAARAEDAANRL